MAKLTHAIHIRIQETAREKIEQLVENGEYQDISSFVVQAINEKLDPDRYQEHLEKSIRETLLRITRDDPIYRQFLKDAVK
jgi:Arc/MetJ-type ribon-helix-helix transcriptional regulator